MISPSHRAVFVHVPKAAGQAVETAFLHDLGLTWEQRAALCLGPNGEPERGPPKLAHLLARDYVALGHISQGEFAAFHKFAIVRDPWARLVSLYRHLGPNRGFRDFVLGWLEACFAQGEAHSHFWFVRPQVDYLTDSEGLLVDEVLPFERLEDAFPAVAARFGLPSALPRVNDHRDKPRPDINGKPPALVRLARRAWRGLGPERFERHRHWRDYLDGETIAVIGRLYAGDADRFGYTPPDAGRRP